MGVAGWARPRPGLRPGRPILAPFRRPRRGIRNWRRVWATPLGSQKAYPGPLHGVTMVRQIVPRDRAVYGCLHNGNSASPTTVMGSSAWGGDCCVPRLTGRRPSLPPPAWCGSPVAAATRRTSAGTAASTRHQGTPRALAGSIDGGYPTLHFGLGCPCACGDYAHVPVGTQQGRNWRWVGGISSCVARRTPWPPAQRMTPADDRVCCVPCPGSVPGPRRALRPIARRGALATGLVRRARLVAGRRGFFFSRSARRGPWADSQGGTSSWGRTPATRSRWSS